MKNPFLIDYVRGFEWWTIGWGAETYQHWLKLGPLTFSLQDRRLELHARNELKLALEW